MMDFIMGWLMGRNIPKEEQEVIQPQKALTYLAYEYWPEFDNEPVSFGDCYDLYEAYNVCHIKSGNEIKTYFETDVQKEDFLRQDKTYHRDI